MVTEVDRFGTHRNRQPEYFFNGIIGHIRADQNGWIDSWEQATQLANLLASALPDSGSAPSGASGNTTRKSLNSGNQAEESQDDMSGSNMDDTDSLVVHTESASAPIQIHQLATVLWNILQQ